VCNVINLDLKCDENDSLLKFVMLLNSFSFNIFFEGKEGNECIMNIARYCIVIV